MSFTTLKETQNKFLETYLRGTDQTLTSAQASAMFGIECLSARVHELRSMGLNIQTVPTKTTSCVAYRMSRRDRSGSQARVLA